jgi:hypothetical protein
VTAWELGGGGAEVLRTEALWRLVNIILVSWGTGIKVRWGTGMLGQQSAGALV